MTDRQNILLVISASEEDESQVVNSFRDSDWTVQRCCNASEARALIRENPPPMVLCERDLPDGTWRDILDLLTALRLSPAALIVISRIADTDLWAEVLHLGGYDLLAKPLKEKEVRWAVESAWLHSCRQKEQIGRLQKAIA